MDYKFTIIVPIFNEADNLIRVENELSTYLKTLNLATKVLLVNDGSTDESQTHIEAICNRNKYFDYISLTKNNGLSAALKAGIENTDTLFTGYIDADLQTSPNDFDLLLEHINDYDLVTGVRLNRKDTFVKKIISKVSNAIRRVFTKDGMTDTGCPLKVIKTESAKQIPMFKGFHRFLPAMILLQGGKIKQVPVSHYARINGTSKFGLKNRFLSPLLYCFIYLWMKRKMINYDIKKKSL
jgi:glycosyltransferase involved in cell wall biosynthesis